MSQIPIENDDNRSVAASDFVKLEPPDEVRDQHGFQENPLDWTLETGSTQHDYENGLLKEQKLMIEKLEAKIETLQSNVKNLELETKIRALEENAEHKANYQALETKFAQMLSTQSEQHHKEMEQLKDGFTMQMAQLEAKNRKLEEKLLSNVEVQTTKNGALDTKMDHLQTEFSKKLAEQQKQMMTQFQAQFHSLEQKLKEAEQRAQTGKNMFVEIIQANQQKMEKFREEMNENGRQAIGSHLDKLNYMWSQLMMAKSKILANPKGIVWDGSKSDVNISECGLNLKDIDCEWGFATEGYAISGEYCRNENLQFPGTIIYYYEVTIPSSFSFSIGFTDGSKPAGSVIVGGSPNSYGIRKFGNRISSYWLSGEKHKVECPACFIAEANVVGLGLLLNSKNEFAIFFTVDGIVLVKQIPIINPTVDRLYPTVFMGSFCASVEANFGDDIVAKPFKFDTDKCPGLVFE